MKFICFFVLLLVAYAASMPGLLNLGVAPQIPIISGDTKGAGSVGDKNKGPLANDINTAGPATNNNQNNYNNPNNVPYNDPYNVPSNNNNNNNYNYNQNYNRNDNLNQNCATGYC